MRVQDLDVSSSAAGTDEFIITNPTTHKSERISFANMLASISTLANLVITTLFKVTGDTELKDTSIVGDVDITGDTSITGDLEVNGDIIQRGSAYETHAEKVYTRDDVINLRDGAISALGADEYAGVIAKHYDTQGHDGALVFDKTGEGRVGDYTVSEVKVYSSDGTTFYSDEEMTEAAVIPSGVTPAATGVENEYSYTVTEDDTEPIMTRDEVASMTDKALIVWDAANRKAKTAGVPNVANLVPVSNANGGFSWGSYQPDAMFVVNSPSISGKALTSGMTIKVMFTADVSGVDTTTALAITYNSNSYNVKVAKNGSLIDFVATEVATSTYKYLQAYTVLEFYYDGTNFIILENPVVLSTDDYKIYADGYYQALPIPEPLENYKKKTVIQTNNVVDYEYTATEDCYVIASQAWSTSTNSAGAVTLKINNKIVAEDGYSGYGRGTEGSGELNVPVMCTPPVFIKKGTKAVFHYSNLSGAQIYGDQAMVLLCLLFHLW